MVTSLVLVWLAIAGSTVVAFYVGGKVADILMGKKFHW